MKKRLIEYDLPLADISEASAREKNIRHGHPSTLHIWWARRPLAASRATAFAALIDDPGEDEPEKREYLLDLIKRITPWEAVKDGNDEAIEEARRLILEQYGEPPKVLDPFAGGGSIPLEALRLGCETYASDYNPVAVFIEKATLEWPQKFGIMVDRALLSDSKNRSTQPSLLPGDGGDKVNLLAYLVDKWANIILEEARAEIGQFYPPDPDGSIPVGYLWARTIPCKNPSCRAEIPLIKSFWLSSKVGADVAYRPIIDQTNNLVSFEVVTGSSAIKESAFDPSQGLVTRGDANCLLCGQVTKAGDVRRISRRGQMGERMVVVVLHNPNETGKRYRPATEEDVRTYTEAKRYLQEKLSSWAYLESPLPTEEMEVNSRYMLPTNYGSRQWQELFNERQKLALISFLERIKANRKRIRQDCELVSSALRGGAGLGVEAQELAEIASAYLAMLLSKLSDFSSKLCFLNYTGGRGVKNTFGRAALSMSWDYIETNVFNPAGASWPAITGNVTQALEKLQFPVVGAGNAQLSSALCLPFADESFDAVLTDPPYYDNVPYAALSDYFYVWLKRAIGDVLPQLFATPLVPKSEEAVMEPTRHSSTMEAQGYFEAALTTAFMEIHRVLKPGGISIVVYAHKTTEGWETMLNGLLQAGLVVTGSWPMHTEKKGRLREMASAALASSIYMVCRKQERQPLGFWNELQPRIKARVEEKLAQFWAEGIAGGDFFISAIGPGMEEYSRYERVESYSGEPVGTDQLLAFIRKVSTDFLVHRLLKGSSAGAIDKEAQFYLTYRWTYLTNKVPFDDARKIASAEGVDLEQLWGRGGFVKKSGSNVEVLGPKQRGEIREVRNMVDAMHQTARLWEQGRKAELTSLLASTGYGQSGAFWQFCQAVAETLINGSKEKQLLEGMLIGKDTYMKESAEIVAEANKPKLEQKGLFE